MMKLHKEHNPIRPIFYWQNAPAYKLPKFITKALKTNASLPYSFNIKNTIQLLQDFQQISLDNNLGLASFDIKNIYTNIKKEQFK
jgi:hypothetical protein